MLCASWCLWMAGGALERREPTITQYPMLREYTGHEKGRITTVYGIVECLVEGSLWKVVPEFRRVICYDTIAQTKHAGLGKSRPCS